MTASPSRRAHLLPPAGLRCAHHADPLGVAADRVRLSWRLAAPDGLPAAAQPAGGAVQLAYQVQVTDEASPEEPAWDTGRVDSADCTGIAYGGPPLQAGGRYTWRVRVWGDSKRGSSAPTPWSEPARFEVELDPAQGWRAGWISRNRARDTMVPPSGTAPQDPVERALAPAPYVRRSFELDQPPASARLYITALGLYEAWLNGQRVGDAVLAPGWTDYEQRIAYQTHDVTSLLRPGENVLGALLGDGWHSGFFGFDPKRAGAHYGTAPELLAQLVITAADGTQQWITTDEQWQVSFGAVRHADLLMGERHDLGAEPRGWAAPGFDARCWESVRYRERDERPLVADPGPPVRVTQDLAPAAITRDGTGRHIVDFGQNLAGWIRLDTAGLPAGTRVRIRHGEVLTADGDLYTENLRTARQADEFLTGAEPGMFEPRFTLHGFRYAEISGYPGELDPGRVTARVVHSDIPATGSFASSLPWLDRLFANIDWGQRGNFISIPTDCPQRDERLGWLGDAQVFVATACYNRDVAAFFGKWMDDVTDAQQPSGAFTDVAPRLTVDWAGAPAWGDAGVIVPWTIYQVYGDDAILARNYPAMTAWMDYLERGNHDYLRSRELGNSYNDWLAPADDLTSHELLATAYWAYDAALMSRVAGVLGRDDDAARYAELRHKIEAAFASAFVAPDGTLTSGTQTAYVLGLHVGVIPASLRAAAAGHLVDAIRAAGWRLTTGFAGVSYLMPVLSAVGRTDVAYRLLEQRELPSWRFMIDNGATTIWERWDGWSAEGGFQSPRMNSFNHYSLGSVGEWLYRFVLGLEQSPGSVGFQRLVVRPHPGGQLEWVRGRYESVRGPIASQWRRADGVFSLAVELPPGVTASVRVPSAAPGQVRDSAGAGPSGIAAYPGQAGQLEAVFEVGPGRHQFSGPALLADPAAVGDEAAS